MDRLHSTNHVLGCTPAYNLVHALDHLLVSVNSQVMEQTNRLVRRHDESMQQMTVKHMAAFMWAFAEKRNRQVTTDTQDEVAEIGRRHAWAAV